MSSLESLFHEGLKVIQDSVAPSTKIQVNAIPIALIYLSLQLFLFSTIDVGRISNASVKLIN